MAVETPTIQVFTNANNLTVTFTNPSAATFNYLKRNGVYISKTTVDSISDPDAAFFSDYQTRSGEQVFYVGSASDGSQESAPTSPLTGTVILSSAWIHQVAKNPFGNITELAAIELFNLEGQQTTQTKEANVLRLAAQEKPRIITASQTQRIIECPIYISSTDWKVIKNDFEQMLWSDELFCFRDPQGELIFCTIPSQEVRIDLNVNMNLVLWESSFDEAIA